MTSFKKIVSFGDSFAWGDELVAPDQTAAGDYPNRFYREAHCYSGLLAKHFGVPCENYGFPGGSCQSSRWIYTWWLQQEPDPQSCLVLVQLSGPWRSSQFDQRRVTGPGDHKWNRFVHSTWLQHYRDHDDLAYRYFMAEQDLTDCLEREILMQAETYLFFQGQNQQVGNVVMFNSQSASLNHSIRPENLLWQGQPLDQLLPDQQFWAQQGHLNESGHEKLAALLIQEIDRVTLTE